MKDLAKGWAYSRSPAGQAHFARLRAEVRATGKPTEPPPPEHPPVYEHPRHAWEQINSIGKDAAAGPDPVTLEDFL